LKKKSRSLPRKLSLVGVAYIVRHTHQAIIQSSLGELLVLRQLYFEEQIP
jgi:hypothetical protein